MIHVLYPAFRSRDPGLLDPGLELTGALLKCRLKVDVKEAPRVKDDRSGVDNPPLTLGLHVIIEP
jgi:hypothetical protein